MLNPKLFQNLSVLWLHQRCVVDEFGFRFYRLRDGSGFVRLSQAEWDAAGGAFREAIEPSARRLSWALMLAIPFTILLLALIHNVPPIGWIFHAIDRVAPLLAYLIITLAMPVTMIALHNRNVQRTVDGLEAALASEPRHAPPVARDRRALNTVEILAVVLIGPHLIVQAIGSLSPGIFRNTPMTGQQLGPTSYAGIAVLVLLGLLRWRQAARPGAPAATEAGPRRSDPLARAKPRDLG